MENGQYVRKCSKPFVLLICNFYLCISPISKITLQISVLLKDCKIPVGGILRNTLNYQS